MQTTPKTHSNAGRSGFTLVEIAFVCLVIGAILAIAIPSYRSIRTEARVRQARQDVEMLSAAISELAWDTGRWPGGILRNVRGDAEIWDLTTSKAGLLAANEGFPNWNGPYIPRITLDPWGMPYFFDPDYTINGVARPVVGSFGPNRVGRNVYDNDDIFIRVDI